MDKISQRPKEVLEWGAFHLFASRFRGPKKFRQEKRAQVDLEFRQMRGKLRGRGNNDNGIVKLGGKRWKSNESREMEQ